MEDMSRGLENLYANVIYLFTFHFPAFHPFRQQNQKKKTEQNENWIMENHCNIKNKNKNKNKRKSNSETWQNVQQNGKTFWSLIFVYLIHPSNWKNPTASDCIHYPRQLSERTCQEYKKESWKESNMKENPLGNLYSLNHNSQAEKTRKKKKNLEASTRKCFLFF